MKGKVCKKSVPYRFIPVEPKRVNIDDKTYESTKAMAYDFWERVAGDKRISDDLKKFLDQGNPIESM